MPLREQWAQCYTKRYRNFGGRVTSTTESTNLAIKSHLINGRGDLAGLVRAIKRMVKEQLSIFTTKLTNNETRVRHEFLEKEYLGELPRNISLKGLLLIQDEYRHYEGSIPKDNRPSKRPLGDCGEGCTVSLQLGVPCRHIIADRISKKETLSLNDVHHHWHLQQPLVSLLIVVASVRIFLTLVL